MKFAGATNRGGESTKITSALTVNISFLKLLLQQELEPLWYVCTEMIGPEAFEMCAYVHICTNNMRDYHANYMNNENIQTDLKLPKYWFCLLSSSRALC